MSELRQGKLLRIFIGEQDRREHMPLYEWIVRRARERNLSGATVLRGVEGFGARSVLHKANLLDLSADLPIIIEIVDTEDAIESFLLEIDEAISEGLATVERVEVRFRRGGKRP
jgi:PII-like signaling protein